MININKEIIVAFIGALVGATITLLVNGWSESKENLDQANLRNMVAEAKEETLEVVKDLLVEVGKERGALEAITIESKENAIFIASQKSEVKEIIDNLKEKTSLSDKDIRRVFEEDVKKQIKSQVDNKFECPNGMVDSGSFCIDNEFRFKKGTNWLSANEGCMKEGLRMCSTSEISGAARLGLIKTYKWSEGNYWVWSDDVVLTKTESGGVFDACHVELNVDEPGYVLGEWNCQLPAEYTKGAIVGMCCK